MRHTNPILLAYAFVVLACACTSIHPIEVAGCDAYANGKHCSFDVVPSDAPYVRVPVTRLYGSCRKVSITLVDPDDSSGIGAAPEITFQNQEVQCQQQGSFLVYEISKQVYRERLKGQGYPQLPGIVLVTVHDDWDAAEFKTLGFLRLFLFREDDEEYRFHR